MVIFNSYVGYVSNYQRVSLFVPSECLVRMTKWCQGAAQNSGVKPWSKVPEAEESGYGWFSLIHFPWHPQVRISIVFNHYSTTTCIYCTYSMVYQNQPQNHSSNKEAILSHPKRGLQSSLDDATQQPLTLKLEAATSFWAS